ncbi:eukaryotic-like serine/threonine-protein kinase [Thermoflexales bacterium]|nr:eukaryotic-like serine/threonine-protein kinase [Thermoflexales bacterium]
MAPQKLEGLNLGKYQLREQLGHGGMASVYRAYHPQLDRFVAVKVLRGELVEDSEFLARFQREAKIVASLRHANVVQVYDADRQDDIYYMVMELLEGDTLKARLTDYRAREEQMPLGEVVRVMLDVLDGLAYAHSEGMVHRDLKPANIMLTRRGQAVITDFGIAQMVGATRYTMSGALMGTLNYMAPEQGMQNQSDVRSDLYSLGIVLYEMLTGKPPFDADTPLAILMKHVNEPLPMPPTTGVIIAAAFERVLLKVLSKDSDDRYQTAEEMAQAIRAAAEEANVKLPDRISLPLSVGVPAAAEPISVISGTARKSITNTDFAKDQTDAVPDAKVSAIAAGSAVGVAGGQTGGAPAAVVETKAIDWWGIIKKHSLIALIWLGIIIGANMVFLAVAGFSGSFDIFIHGWPLQVLVVGLAFAYVMFATRWLWVLIPTNTLLITGVISSYYWFIDRGNWATWILIAPVVVGTIIVTIILYVTNRKLASQVAYHTGLILMVLTGTAIFGGTMYLLTNPEVIQQLPYSRLIDQALERGLSEGLKNLPDIPELKDLLTPAP